MNAKKGGCLVLLACKYGGRLVVIVVVRNPYAMLGGSTVVTCSVRRSSPSSLWKKFGDPGSDISEGSGFSWAGGIPGDLVAH